MTNLALAKVLNTTLESLSEMIDKDSAAQTGLLSDLYKDLERFEDFALTAEEQDELSN